MNWFFVFIAISAQAELHSYMSTYTGVTGIPELPEFTGVTKVDTQEVHFYDSSTNLRIPKQEWMKKVDFENFWKEINAYHDEVIKQLNESFDVIKKNYNKTDVHTYLWMGYCEWDNETGSIKRSSLVGFDGEDHIKLDLRTKKFISQRQEADDTAENWNNKTDVVKHFLDFIIYDCLNLLQKYLKYGKTTFYRTVPPKVFLLQKNSSSSVVCQATGFYPEKVNITWRKNGQELHEYVETGETLPNMDGTFQKRVYLRVTRAEWKKNQYSCVVRHKSLKNEIQKILREDDVLSNNITESNTPLLTGLFVLIFLLIVFGAIILWKYKSITTTILKPSETRTTSC